MLELYFVSRFAVCVFVYSDFSSGKNNKKPKMAQSGSVKFFTEKGFGFTSDLKGFKFTFFGKDMASCVNARNSADESDQHLFFGLPGHEI